MIDYAVILLDWRELDWIWLDWIQTPRRFGLDWIDCVDATRAPVAIPSPAMVVL